MGMTLTGLIPTLYTALDIVSREQVGFIAAASRDSSGDQAAVGQTITMHVTPEATAEDITPGQTPPDTGDQTIGALDMEITKSRGVPIRWSGEEQLSVGQYGTYNKILADQFVQAMRTLCNEVEADTAALYTAASRAYGTAGTTPFGTAGDFSDFAQVQKILDDNGCPDTDRQLVLGSSAIANIRGKQSVLFKANEAGTDALLRRGILGQVEGLDIHASKQVKTHTKGTGASYQTNLVSPLAIGDTTVAIDTGTGTVLAGDVVTFNGDTNKYVNGTALSGGNIVLNEPGLQAALADGVAMTVGNSYTANMAFHRGAIAIMTRAPAMPEDTQGNKMDMADDVRVIVDPVSGLAFQVALYRLYRRVRYEVGLAWGVKAVKSAHIATLMG